MSVEGMYQGCIMRNMRTKETSFRVPFSSETRRSIRNSRWIIMHVFSKDSLALAWQLLYRQKDMQLRWPTESLDAGFDQLVHWSRLLRQHGLHGASPVRLVSRVFPPSRFTLVPPAVHKTGWEERIKGEQTRAITKQRGRKWNSQCAVLDVRHSCVVSCSASCSSPRGKQSVAVYCLPGCHDGLFRCI